MSRRFDGRAVLITGAGGGIGSATALGFAREGARLVLSDCSEPLGKRITEEALAEGAEVRFVRADVTQRSEVEALVEQAVATYGRLDAAFNNAGTEGHVVPLVETDEEGFERVLDVNLSGVWRCMRCEIPRMLASGGGVIVNTASVAGLVGAAGFTAYAASKHGVVGLTRAAAVEYATSGIRINAVCPGVIDTAMVDRIEAAIPDARAQLLARKPMARLGSPEEVASAVLWLCSDEASFVTGHAMAIDGGYVAQ